MRVDRGTKSPLPGVALGTELAARRLKAPVWMPEPGNSSETLSVGADALRVLGWDVTRGRLGSTEGRPPCRAGCDAGRLLTPAGVPPGVHLSLVTGGEETLNGRGAGDLSRP